MINKHLFGSYITMTFADIYPSYSEFEKDFNELPFNFEFKDNKSLSLIYYLLYAKYGNSNISSSDINQFKFQLFALIYQYGATWERKLELQDALRKLTDEDILTSSIQIINHASNPSTAPTTSSLEELPFINAQTASGYKKNKTDAYSFLYDVLRDDITSEFIGRFKRLFISVVMPQAPLWYISETDNLD